MLKKAIYSILLIAATAFTVGYFRYNPTVNFKDKIPASANVVIRVNLRTIEYNILKDVLSSPFSYLKLTNSSKKAKKNSLINNVEIPTDIFFYSSTKVSKIKWISSAVKIKNVDCLKTFFKEQNLIEKSIDNIDCFINKNIIYCIDKDELKILFTSGETIQSEDELSIVFNDKTYLTNTDNVLKRLIKSDKSIVVSTKKEDFIEVDTDNEKLLVNGELNKNNQLFLPYQTKKSDNNIAFVSGKLNTEFLFSFLDDKVQSKIKKTTNLSLDSIGNYWNGAINFQLKSFNNKIDTIVTYDYDEDFNKVEKKTIQKTSIPSFNLELGGVSFFDYLSAKEMIKNVEGGSLLVVNPLFNTYASKNNKSLFLSSNKTSLKRFENLKNDKFSLFLDVEKYIENQTSLYEFSNKKITLIKQVKAVITSENKLEGEISLKDTSKNAFYQFLN